MTTRRWIAHTYFTQGYYKHGIEFVLSFRKHHPDMHILVSGRGLSPEEVFTLKRAGDVTVTNSHLDVHLMVEETRKNLAVLHDYEKSVVNREPPGDNLLWKLYISVKDRYRLSLEEALSFGHHVLHFDADTLIKKPLDPLLKMINRHDICIKFKDYECQNGPVLGSLISFRQTPQTKQFIKTWHKMIDKTKVHDRPRGYGQKSFYRAYLKTRDVVNFGRIPDSFMKRGRRSPRRGGLVPKKNFSGWKSDYVEKIR